MARVQPNKLNGVAEVFKRIERLKKGKGTPLLRAGVEAAMVIVNKDAKARCPKQTGLLRKSIGKKTQTYRKSGTVIGVCGPRTEQGGYVEVDGKPEYRDPVNYSHLAERTTPFMRPALDENKAACQNAMAAKIKEKLEHEAKRA